MKKVSVKKAAVDKNIIRYLKVQWKNCSNQTADFMKAVPFSEWYNKPFQFKFKSFSWELACIARARFCYLEAFKTGRLSFTDRPSVPKKTALELEQKNSLVNKLKIADFQLLKQISIINSPQKIDLIVWLLQHERLHQGKLILYLATKGLRIPASFKKTWKG